MSSKVRPIRVTLVLILAGAAEDEVKNLLEKKASVNTSEDDGNTPLMFAAASQHLNIIKMLLEYKANINQINNREDMTQETALSAAISYSDDTNILKLLLEHKADIYAGETPALNDAAISNRKEIATMLLTEYKADINKTDTQGNTALMNAAAMGSLATAKALLQFKNIDINHKNFWGETARDRAARVGQSANNEIIKLLDEIISFRDKQNIFVFGLFSPGKSSLKTFSGDYLFDSNTVKIVSNFLRPKQK